MRQLFPYLYLALIFISSCNKESQCGPNIIIDQLELSPASEQGLLLHGNERIIFSDGDGNNLIFKSLEKRIYRQHNINVNLVCEGDDYLSNQFETIQSESYSIVYKDSIDQNKTMTVTAKISEDNNLIIEKTQIEIRFRQSTIAICPLMWHPRYDLELHQNISQNMSFFEENPFLNNIIDTTFNNILHSGVARFDGWWGPLFYNRHGILQFKEIGDTVWTLESIN